LFTSRREDTPLFPIPCQAQVAVDELGPLALLLLPFLAVPHSLTHVVGPAVDSHGSPCLLLPDPLAHPLASDGLLTLVELLPELCPLEAVLDPLELADLVVALEGGVARLLPGLAALDLHQDLTEPDGTVLKARTSCSRIAARALRVGLFSSVIASPLSSWRGSERRRRIVRESRGPTCTPPTPTEGLRQTHSARRSGGGSVAWQHTALTRH
jgi:hypothetical protein